MEKKMEGLTKKQMKKWKGSLAKLAAAGLDAGTKPTQTVVVGNGGLHNGVCPTKLLELLRQFGEVKSFSVIPRKSYATVTYFSVESAASAFDCLQCHEIEKSDGGPRATLYLYFLQTDLNITGSNKNVLLPKGLVIQEDFITEKEEDLLIKKIENDIAAHSKDSSESEMLKHRQVLHYGYKFRYGSNDVDLDDPMSKVDMPAHITDIIDGVMKTQLWEEAPDQCTVNKYEPGHGIPFHVDNPKAFSASISSLSLGSAILFEMRHPVGNVYTLLLKPRSLLTLTGESRYQWTHGIKPKKTDVVHNQVTNTELILQRGTRWSLTLRKVKENCDNKDLVLPTEADNAVEVEKMHVHGVYNKIAGHFASTREKPWPNVVKFLESLDPYSLVLDVGCGSGRYLLSRSDLFMFGCDHSSSLIKICDDKHPFVFVCDGLSVPVKANRFDACICIAVIHHYFTVERRVAAIKEILRIVRPGGKALIYVWAAEQAYKNKNSSYLKPKAAGFSQQQAEIPDEKVENDCCTSLPIHKNRNHFVQQDVFVPWKLKNSDEISQSEMQTHYRFYHVFREGELVELCHSTEECIVEESYHDNGNWAIILRKNL